jgi:hypothetical protein
VAVVPSGPNWTPLPTTPIKKVNFSLIYISFINFFELRSPWLEIIRKTCDAYFLACLCFHILTRDDGRKAREYTSARNYCLQEMNVTERKATVGDETLLGEQVELCAI